MLFVDFYFYDNKTCTLTFSAFSYLKIANLQNNVLLCELVHLLCSIHFFLYI